MRLEINSNFNKDRKIQIDYDNCYFELSSLYIYIYNVNTDKLIGDLTIEEYNEQLKKYDDIMNENYPLLKRS